MSKLLNDLIQNREELRAMEKSVTQAIKAERKAITLAKKPPPPPANKQMEMNKALREENARLRRLVAMLKKSNNSTYKQVGEMLGVSAGRARQIIDSERRHLLLNAKALEQ